MNFIEKKAVFERTKKIYESNILTFHGVDDYDVYNCSIPFFYEGERFVFGRVEKRNEWATSNTRLFKETGTDDFSLVLNSMIYPLEDPYVTLINGEFVLGGTHVQKSHCKLDAFYAYFYKGTDLHNLSYFATGPKNMKDIRLIDLQENNVGLFSRPRSKEIEKKYGSASIVGFTVIENISTNLDATTIESAPIVEGLFDKGEWGGCNQCYLLDNGNIGVIGHKCYEENDQDGVLQQVYTNVSFVVNTRTQTVIDEKIIGTRSCYPSAVAKKPFLNDCAFTSGIVLRDDGKVDLYSGLGDICEGRITIDNPFDGFGKFVN